MARMARSALGVIVDFDLIEIRQQLANAPAPIEVSARREYIDNKDAGRVTSDALLAPINVEIDTGPEDFENPN